MLSELEEKIQDGLKELIEKCFGKDLEHYDPLKTTELFFVMYKSLAVLLKRDFDMQTELTVKEITLQKPTEIKTNIPLEKTNELSDAEKPDTK